MKTVASMNSVKDVIERGKIINTQYTWKGRNYDTVVFAVTIKMWRNRRFIYMK